MFVCSVSKVSQVMMKRHRRAHISVDLVCGTMAAELHNSVDLLCGTTAAEPHNSVDLVCGTMAAETFERWMFWKIQQTQIDSRPSANSWNVYTLQRFSKLLKDERFTKTIKDLSKGLRTHESPHELDRQSEAKRKQAPQSKANVCRWQWQNLNAISKKPLLLIAQGTQ